MYSIGYKFKLIASRSCLVTEVKNATFNDFSTNLIIVFDCQRTKFRAEAVGSR